MSLSAPRRGLSARFAIVLGVLLGPPLAAGEEAGPDGTPGADAFASRVAPIFERHCTGCHNPEDRDGGLDLTTYAGLREGSEDGPVVAPGDSAASRIIGVLTGRERPRMPPGRREPPAEEEVAVLAAWIDAGAAGPREPGERPRTLRVPRLEPLGNPRTPVTAVAASPGGRLLAVARRGRVELRDAASLRPLAGLACGEAAVFAAGFSGDGRRVWAAGGVPGLRARAWLWAAGPRRLLGSVDGHRDAAQAGALSPDGRVLATGGWDAGIRLWDTSSGEGLRSLEGHNGAVHALAFRPDGQVLASASEDWTVKLWDPVSGDRLDTFSEPEGAVHALAFHPGGGRLAAGGADRRIRVWKVSGEAREGTNELLASRFAHEGAVTAIDWSPGASRIASGAADRSVKLWDAERLEERWVAPEQSDEVAGLAFVAGGRLVVGRLDGSLAALDLASGREIRLSRAGGGAPDARGAVSRRRRTTLAAFVAAGDASDASDASGASAEEDSPDPEPPEIVRLVPRTVPRGVTTRVRVVGRRLGGGLEARSSSPRVRVRARPPREDGGGAAWIDVRPGAELPRGPHRLRVATPAGPSAWATFWVDDLPAVPEEEPNDRRGRGTPGSFPPLSFTGAIAEPGDVDRFVVDARGGVELVVDCAVGAIASELQPVVTVRDATGRVLATDNALATGQDPLLAITPEEDGPCEVTVADAGLAGSPDHVYRLSVGELPVVTAVHPLSGTTGEELEVELVGHHLPEDAEVRVELDAPGEVDVPVDRERFRVRGPLRVLSHPLPQTRESEPDGRPEAATRLPVPCAAVGRFRAPGAAAPDEDLFRFASEAGRTWVIETVAARRGAPVDTRIEVLHPDGRPVLRALLQAVRDSYINFRAIDADGPDVRLKNWEEMDLDQYLWLEGEVGRIFRMPRGPDSGLRLWTSAGKRRTWFGTTATTHPNGQTVYVVEPHPLDADPVPSGLPVFEVPYANDDDGLRRGGRDSRLRFTAPRDGDYLVRVSEVHGRTGPQRGYRLVVRKAEPDFRVRVAPDRLEVNEGSGKAFALRVERIDGHEAEVRVDFEGVPEGWYVTTPLRVEPEHTSAEGAVVALPGAEARSGEAWQEVRAVVTSTVAGREVRRELPAFRHVGLGGPPPLRVALEPAARAPAASASTAAEATGEVASSGEDRALAAAGGPRIPEITIAPGAEVPALLRLERTGHEGRVTFEMANLPHGVIVNDIGLNGVLIPPGETERRIFIRAADWVGETDRLAHARASQGGGQASFPVLLRVRRGGEPEAAAAR